MNLINHPEDFNGASWTKVLITDVQSNQATAPDGTLTADRLIIADAVGGNSSVIVEDDIPAVDPSTLYFWSCFCQADNLNWARLVNVGFTTPATGGQYYDLLNGVTGIDRGFTDYGIVAYPNDWYRCWYSFITDAVDTNGQVRVQVAEADGDASVPRNGQSSIIIWGAQLQAAAELPPYEAVSGWSSDVGGLTFQRDLQRSLRRDLQRSL